MNRESKKVSQSETIRRTVCGTEYIVTGEYAPTARETVIQKMERLLLQEAQNSGMIQATVLHMAAQKKGVQHD